mgnify:CR=1 FL=1
MGKLARDILIWIWCFPQMLLGLIYYIVLRNKIIKKEIYKGVPIYCFKGKIVFGVSLGTWIFIEEKIYNKNTIKHEYGHVLQHYILGPFALLIIDIPSAIQFLISRYNKNFSKNYYKRFPENWADKLGKVKRR